MQAMESQFDVCTEDLFNQTIKLEEMEKKAGNAEGEVSALRSRLILLQENNEKQEERLCKATLELAGACKRADAAVKKRIELEKEVRKNFEKRVIGVFLTDSVHYGLTGNKDLDTKMRKVGKNYVTSTEEMGKELRKSKDDISIFSK